MGSSTAAARWATAERVSAGQARELLTASIFCTRAIHCIYQGIEACLVVDGMILLPERRLEPLEIVCE